MVDKPSEVGTLQTVLRRLDLDRIVWGRQFEHICK